MPPNLRLSAITHLTGRLTAETPAQKSARTALRTALADAMKVDSVFPGLSRAFSFEASDDFMLGRLDEENQAELRSLAGRAPAAESRRFFRRETPVFSNLMGGSLPEWGKGVAIERTLGHFSMDEGRRLWFDFYLPAKKLRPLYLQQSETPAVLFEVALADVPTMPAPGAFSLKLSAGSLWIQAKLLAADAKQGTYVGFKIAKGEVTGQGLVKDANQKIMLARLQSTATFKLDLSQAAAPAVATDAGTFGSDSRAAKVALPATITFTLSKDGLKLDSIGNASWTLYGQECKFEWDSSKTNLLSPLTDRLLIPMKPSVNELVVNTQQSPLCKISGRSKIDRAAWLMHMTPVDLSEWLPAAAGTGALGLNCAGGLTAQWTGLEGGAIVFRNPWVVLDPIQLEISDTQAGNKVAKQTFTLWSQENQKFNSTFRLSYTNKFRLQYISAYSGQELLSTRANLSASIDRPLQATGIPVLINSLKAEWMVFNIGAQKHVYLYDDNILKDNFSVSDKVEPMVLALQNALLQTTPPSSCVLFGELTDNKVISKGQLFLSFGLFTFLPSLPDPYTANLDNWKMLFPQVRGAQTAKDLADKIDALLTARLTWSPITKKLTFNMGLLEAGSFGLEVLDRRILAVLMNPGVNRWLQKWNGQCGTFPIFMTTTPISEEEKKAKEFEDKWNSHFSLLEKSMFTLLDLSSQADLMGVSLNCREKANEAILSHWLTTHTTGVSQITDIDGFPVKVQEMKMVAPANQMQVFLPPQISWEPLYDLSEGEPKIDDTSFKLTFESDGGATRLGSLKKNQFVPITPASISEFLTDAFSKNPTTSSWAVFTMPFGMKAFAKLQKDEGDAMALILPNFKDDIKGIRQLRLFAQKQNENGRRGFRGFTLQLNNVRNQFGSLPKKTVKTGKPYPFDLEEKENITSVLGKSVTGIFNSNFFPNPQYTGENLNLKKEGVPVERIDFSGYGANVFSHWNDKDAVIAAVSKAHFEVWRGRTAHEVVQVKSLLYPWGIRVVRTITIFRSPNGRVFRYDSGWLAQSDGVFDFRLEKNKPQPYEIHPGIVNGVYNIRNIRETTEVSGFLKTSPPPENKVIYELQPVCFDADVELVQGVNGSKRFASRRILGYIQIEGQLLLPKELDKLLVERGPFTASIEGEIALAGTPQKMRTHHIELSGASDRSGASDGTSNPIVVGAVRGSVILPREGSWSIIRHAKGTGEVHVPSATESVPLVRVGKLGTPPQKSWRISDPADLLKETGTSLLYAFLQDTGTQKMILSKPKFTPGTAFLDLEPNSAFFTDALSLLNSSGVFPNIKDAFPIDLGGGKFNLLEKGFNLDVPKDKKLNLGERDLVLFELGDVLKIYVKYPKDALNYGLNALAEQNADRWASKLNDIAIVLDLGPFKGLMTISGALDAGQGKLPVFSVPKIKFNKVLQPVMDILQFLSKFSSDDPQNPPAYGDILSQGLKIAFSNAPDSWEYKFSISKEIPFVKFPIPDELFNNPATAFKLEIGMKLGMYFNEVIKFKDGPSSLIPSIGGFIEFSGRTYCMVLSVGVGTIFAIGTVKIRLSADSKKGVEFGLQLGYGAQIVVGIPGLVNAYVMFTVSFSLVINGEELWVGACIMFNGRAEILSGLVTINILIEAQGSIEVGKTLKSMIGGFDNFFGELTSMEMYAQVTFAVDITVCWFIHIDYSKSWQETRRVN